MQLLHNSIEIFKANVILVLGQASASVFFIVCRTLFKWDVTIVLHSAISGGICLYYRAVESSLVI